MQCTVSIQPEKNYKSVVLAFIFQSDFSFTHIDGSIVNPSDGATVWPIVYENLITSLQNKIKYNNDKRNLECYNFLNKF